MKTATSCNPIAMSLAAATLVATELDRIEVTGPRIRGTATPPPVVTVGSKRIREEGLADPGELVRSLPKSFGGGQAPGVGIVGFSGAGLANQNVTAGASQSQCGLGPDAALTLFNGQRMAYRGYVQIEHRDDSACCAINSVAVLCRQGGDPAPQAPDTFDDTAPPRAAFDAAVAYLRPDLLRYMNRRIGDAETAADLTQETLLRMLIYRDAPGIGSHALLMYRIAHNLLLEYWRARHRHHATAHIPLDLIEPLHDHTAPVEDIVDARNALHTLTRHTFPSLSARCSQAFRLHRVDGLTYPEIAATMGVSVKMVEKHISKALAVCRAAVG